MILFYLWTFIFLPNTNGLNSEPIDFLTNGTQKTWYLVAQTPEEDTPSCKASSPQSTDNTYTFYADGRFELDHGQITEDPNCEGEGCCYDPHSITGTWKFINDGKGLLIKALHKKGDESYTIDHTFFNGNYNLLEEGRLILTASGITSEYHPK